MAQGGRGGRGLTVEHDHDEQDRGDDRGGGTPPARTTTNTDANANTKVAAKTRFPSDVIRSLMNRSSEGTYGPLLPLASMVQYTRWPARSTDLGRSVPICK